ncbi:hypothetical protein ACRQ5D_28680 [Mucilaginibacter sp. P25]
MENYKPTSDDGRPPASLVILHLSGGLLPILHYKPTIKHRWQPTR